MDWAWGKERGGSLRSQESWGSTSWDGQRAEKPSGGRGGETGREIVLFACVKPQMQLGMCKRVVARSWMDESGVHERGPGSGGTCLKPQDWMRTHSRGV